MIEEEPFAVKSIKVVVIGAGSGIFGRSAVADLLGCEELNQSADLSVVLVDVDERALERMARFASLLRDYRGVRTRVEATTDRRGALRGADYVITSVARDRLPLWEQDFTIPLSYGFRHIYGENGGPGAAFHTLRSIHLVMPIIRDIEAICPDALVLNYTNPESRVCLAISRLTGVRTLGICHGVVGTHAAVARILDRPPEEVEMTIGGINHFHWVMGLRDAPGGGDLMPLFREAMAQGKGRVPPLARLLYDTFGLLPHPSDSHVGEYVGFAWDVVGPVFFPYRRHYLARRQGAADGQPGDVQTLQQVADGEAPMTEQLVAPSTEITVPVIRAIEFDRGDRFDGINVPNTDPSIRNLPADAVVEVPATADRDGVHPLSVGSLPEGIAGLCRLQISIQNLLLEAYADRSRAALRQALLLEPTVDSVERVELMMDEMLARQADYLPLLE
jgi:alpha-galactosidase